MRKINKIIIHCSATPEGRDVSPEEIKRWHVEERGWSDVGYHFIITIDGVVHSGRPLEIQGAHTKGHNSESIGICYVGGMDKEMKSAKDTRTEEQKESLVNLICELKDIYDCKVYGHNNFSNKECPSFDAKNEYK
tara:strand:+ start:1179 stop:1583 length:405 start_codon:yes stop_codon:yes gene_type:complete